MKKRKKRYKYYTDELCPECNREVRIPARAKPIPNCPSCKKPLIPCSACDHEADGCDGCEDGSKFKLHPGEKVKKTGFRLSTIRRMALKAYTGFVATESPFEVGDTLASFIVSEIKETYDKWAAKPEQMEAAYVAMQRARNQLQEVENALGTRMSIERLKAERKKKRRKK